MSTHIYNSPALKNMVYGAENWRHKKQYKTKLTVQSLSQNFIVKAAYPKSGIKIEIAKYRLDVIKPKDMFFSLAIAYSLLKR